MMTQKNPTPEELKYWRQFTVSACVRCRQETSIPLRHILSCPGTPPPAETQAAFKAEAKAPRVARESSLPTKKFDASLPKKGDRIGSFTVVEVLSGTLPLSQHKDRCHLRVRCVCNRERVRLYQGSYPDRWNETCGCNGIDHIRIGGDPSLPAQVTTLPELVAWGGWAGMTSFYARKNTVGMSATVQQLSQLAEARHPGEGWRIPRIIPVPGEVLLLAPPTAVAMPALVLTSEGSGPRGWGFKDMLGQKVAQWTVIGGPRGRHTCHPKRIEWLCACACGLERWYSGRDLRRTDNKRVRAHCKTELPQEAVLTPTEQIAAAESPAQESPEADRPSEVQPPTPVPVPIGKEAKRGVRNLHVGNKVGEFVVEEVVGSCASRGTMHLRCICGRMRVMALNSAHGLRRTTCGCNGMDTVSVAGDPNLPPGITTYFALVRWAGVVVPSHHWMAIHKYGLARGIAMLAEVAEKTHPGEGWRVKAVLPIPGEAPLETK